MMIVTCEDHCSCTVRLTVTLAHCHPMYDLCLWCLFSCVPRVLQGNKWLISELWGITELSSRCPMIKIRGLPFWHVYCFALAILGCVFSGLGKTVNELEIGDLPVFSKTNFCMLQPDVDEYMKQFPGEDTLLIVMYDFVCIPIDVNTGYFENPFKWLNRIIILMHLPMYVLFVRITLCKSALFHCVTSVL